jgi:hypothetical protein
VPPSRLVLATHRSRGDVVAEISRPTPRGRGGGDHAALGGDVRLVSGRRTPAWSRIRRELDDAVQSRRAAAGAPRHRPGSSRAEWCLLDNPPSCEQRAASSIASCCVGMAPLPHLEERAGVEDEEWSVFVEDGYVGPTGGEDGRPV